MIAFLRRIWHDFTAVPGSPKKRTVVVLAKYYFPFNGGIENSTQVFCEGLTSRYNVKVICFNHNPGTVREVINDVYVERYSTLAVVSSQPISFMYFLAAIFSRGDIVHFHAPNVLASLALALSRPRRLIAVHHMDIYGRYFLRMFARRIYDSVLRHADMLLVTSLKNSAVSSDIRVPVRTYAVPLGIDPRLYTISSEERDAALIWRSKLVGSAPLVGFLGRHARYKGLDVLIRAVAELPHVHAVIAGEGPYRTSAEDLSRELGILNRIHFLGEVDHRYKLQLLSAIDLFVFPSTEITEAFGISQVEAMLMGAAVIASDLPTGVTDISIHNDTAILFPPKDAHALARAIDQLINDADSRSTLSKRAHAKVLECFTTSIMVQRFNDLNNDLLDFP